MASRKAGRFGRSKQEAGDAVVYRVGEAAGLVGDGQGAEGAWAYICERPQGSNRDGIRRKSEPAYMRRAFASSKPISTPTTPGMAGRASARNSLSKRPSPRPVTTICPAGGDVASAASMARSTPFWWTRRGRPPRRAGPSRRRARRRGAPRRRWRPCPSPGIEVEYGRRDARSVRGSEARVDAVDDAGEPALLGAQPQQALEPAAEFLVVISWA